MLQILVTLQLDKFPTPLSLSHGECNVPRLLILDRYAMSFAGLDMKKLHERRRSEDSKIIHVLSSGYKAIFSWESLRTLQVGNLQYSCTSLFTTT